MRSRDFLTGLLTTMLREIDKELARLGRRMETLEIQRDRLSDLLKGVKRLQRSTLAGTELPPDRPSGSKSGAPRFPIVGVEIHWLHDGSAVATLTHKELSAPEPVQKIVRLIPTAARVFEMLIHQPVAPDGFPKTMTLEEIAKRLSAKEGTVTTRTVSERLTRLREAFTAAGLNRHWIDRDDARAIRVLLLRKPPGASTHDP